MRRAVMIAALFVAARICFAAQKVHFSIDDVNAALRDLTENEKKYGSLFDQKFFRYLKALNERYGVKVTLYCFFELDGFQLADCTKKFRDEFSANADWLKFGYHAYGSDIVFSDDGGGYAMFVESVLDFAGSGQCISRTVRLDRFSGGKEEIEDCSWLKTKYGIRQLLTADSRTRRSYYLDGAALEALASTERYADTEIGIEFFATDFRFDDYRDFKKFMDENCGEEEIVVFTHEWLLDVPPRKNIFLYAQALYKKWRVKKNISEFLVFAKNEKFECITEF